MHHPPVTPLSRLRRGTAALAAAALGAAGLAALPGVAAADVPAGQTITTVGSTDVVVPTGVDKVTIVADGAEGGTSSWPESSPGGKGGQVTATLAVTPGETLVVNVGGQGGSEAQAGVNGGGSGMDFSGGGGGATDVRRGGTELADRVVVAGGGGGGAQQGPEGPGGAGGNGGVSATAGGTAPDSGGAGGQPGTAESGGSGGAGGGPFDSGSAGTLGQGGAGGHGADNGGGGGGGYYGGGGGGGGGMTGGGGGGGGSSWAAPSATAVSFADGSRSGDGQVTLTWIAAPTTTAPTTTVPTTATPPKASTCPTNPYKVTPGLVWITNVLVAFCNYVTVDIQNAVGHSRSTWAISTVWLAGLKPGACPTAKRIWIQPNHELIAFIIGIACPYSRLDTKVGGRSVSYLVRR